MKNIFKNTSALFSLLCLGSMTPVHADAMYLTCTIDEYRSLKYGEPKIINGKVVSVPIDGAAWSDWEPTQKGPRVLKFTLNESDQTGSLFDEQLSKSYKLPMVTFQPESILAKKSGIKLSSSIPVGSDTYTISRIDGSAIWDQKIIPDQYTIQYSGQCAKSQPKKTLF
ncbi:hypothetical protein [Synechococcus sp. N5]|uniref:hypothetical protein n=1 Tax=Synechococcus sp. N5 TaxID=2575515 RepID=UPI000E0FBDF1|nr:hypothetical protein [Synechococcus sp. N5]